MFHHQFPTCRTEDAMQQYRKDFLAYKERKRKESGGGGGIRIEWNSDSGMKIDTGRAKGALDLSEMPRFNPPKQDLANAMGPTIVDFGLLALYTLTAFAGAFVGFLRYDVR